MDAIKGTPIEDATLEIVSLRTINETTALPAWTAYRHEPKPVLAKEELRCVLERKVSINVLPGPCGMVSFYAWVSDDIDAPDMSLEARRDAALPLLADKIERALATIRAMIAAEENNHTETGEAAAVNES